METLADLTELNWALDHNTNAIRTWNGSIAGYCDLLIQRNNILTMILQATQELNNTRKVA